MSARSGQARVDQWTRRTLPPLYRSALLGAVFALPVVVLLVVNCAQCRWQISREAVSIPVTFFLLGSLAGLLAQCSLRWTTTSWRILGVGAYIAATPLSYLMGWTGLVVAGRPHPEGLDVMSAFMLLVRISPVYPVAAVEPSTEGLAVTVLGGLAPYLAVSSLLYVMGWFPLRK